MSTPSLVSKVVPWVSLTVATVALGFQLGVLLPWHHQLDNDFKILEKKQEAKLIEFHQLKVGKLELIDLKMDALVKLSKDRRSNSWGLW